MIRVLDKEMIRRLHRVRGWSERRIAREFGFARMTVRKYLREECGGRSPHDLPGRVRCRASPYSPPTPRRRAAYDRRVGRARIIRDE